MTRFEAFLKTLYPRKKQSVWQAVLGKKQSGKTDFCLFIMEKLHDLGLMDAFGSNVPVTAPFKVDFIDNFESLEARCRMLNPNPQKQKLKRYFYFASEMGKWLPKDQAWRNTEFIEKLQTVRKYGLSWIGDAIDSVEGRVLNPTHFDGCFHKLSPTDPTSARYDNWVTGRKTLLYGIPRTKIAFDTWYSANFYMKPQAVEGSEIPLDQDHRMIQEYLSKGKSWDKTEWRRTQGKRAVDRVLEYHMTYCVRAIHDEASTKDS